MPLRAVSNRKLIRQNILVAKELYPELSPLQLSVLRDLTTVLRLSVRRSELLFLGGGWYVSHSGLLRIAHQRKCFGIDAAVDQQMSDASAGRWIFKATVRKSHSKSFVAYGDADPSNVSPRVRGSEMRVAETRAVCRALRKAYGIGICAVEELGPLSEPHQPNRESRKLSPQAVNGNYGGPKVRDRLCELIRRYQLDASLVKSYATDFCGVKTLREATREQVENFVVHLADSAEKSRDALLCQLNSYSAQKADVA